LLGVDDSGAPSEAMDMYAVGDFEVAGMS